MSTAGLNLQAVWTRLKSPLHMGDRAYQHYIIRLFKWMSTKPAQILGLNNRGSIEPGKLADFVVWYPETL